MPTCPLFRFVVITISKSIKNFDKSPLYLKGYTI
jgi:hypothetical protein